MSYAQRAISVIFAKAGKTPIRFDGLQCSAVVNMAGGTQASAAMELRVWGMTLSQMNELSSAGAQMVAVSNDTVTLLAGDVNGNQFNVFEGTMFRAFMDFSAIPDVAFVVSAVAGLYQKSVPIAPRTYAGAQFAENIIESLAQSIGFSFVNDSGAHAVLRDQYTYGSAIDQIKTVANAAGIPVEIANNTVTIWPNDGFRDQTIIDIGPGNGLVGYPTYYEAGFIVRSEFNPAIAMGRQIRLKSSIPKANGTWPVQTVTHELFTQQEDGPWFTTTRLAPSPYVANN